MPESRWLSPLFWMGAAPSFLLTAFWLRGFDNIAGWLALLLAWLVGAVVGWILVTLFLWRFPDAKYRTRDKTDEPNDVWNSCDVLMPYLFMGIFVVICLLLNQFSHYRRPDHPLLPRIFAR